MKSKISIPSLKISNKTNSTKTTTKTTTTIKSKKGSESSRRSLNISSPVIPKLNNDVEVIPVTSHRKDFSSLMDQLTYFAFGVDDSRLLEDMSEEKQLYFKKQLERYNCFHIIDDKISRIFEINFNKETYICFFGPNSKLFDLFRLVIYMNIYKVNSIKTQLKLTSQDGNVLLFLPLIYDNDYNRTYDSDHNTIFSARIPPKSSISEKESEQRKLMEEEEYQRKIDELDRKHKEFLEQNGLVNIMNKTLNEIKLRGEKLEELSNQTTLMEGKTQNFLQNVKQLTK